MNPSQQQDKSSRFSIVDFLKCCFKPEKRQPAKKGFVKVRIFDLPSIGLGCNPTTCGPDSVSVKMMADQLKSDLEEIYPGKTSIEYVNLIWVPKEQETNFGQLLVAKKRPSPLVIIEDEVRYAGSIQAQQIIADVGKLL